MLSNFTSPPVLFFFLGMLAVLVRSNLEIPSNMSRFFSLYLLFSIGFKGGVELSHSGFTTEVVVSMVLAITLALVVPFYSFLILKRITNVYNAGAICATYGSISAVTYITASAFLQQMKVDFGGHMVASMALMESPAIVVGVLLVRKLGEQNPDSPKTSLKHLIHEAVTDGSVLLIVGSLLIGMTTSSKGAESVKPFYDEIFKGMLCFFLLDLGMGAARKLNGIREGGKWLVLFALVMPLFNACLAATLSHFAGLELGNAFLITVLAASASYIAVPAAMRIAVPEANPGVYVSMALVITFPFNIILGLPMYFELVKWFQTV